jgi:LmbE family N-acetylglucosaminyl deacetylase
MTGRPGGLRPGNFPLSPLVLFPLICGMKTRFMKRILFLFSGLISLASFAQSARQPDAAEIRLRMKKLNFLGAVLYVAAHPDDENTRAIAWLVNEQLAATAYLSLTRGDGGQNLIGPEIRDLLGLIRTQELLAARRIDGGQQFFTRANDFGFSKSATETFEIWPKAEILSDVVRVIRTFQPDVILTRFPPDERAGHGQHTASAILAQEAFALTNDPHYHPEQVKELGVWHAERLLLNTGRWWNQTVNENTPGIVSLNLGSYNALLGKSYSEIAATSRSQHKSQGFGSSARRGDALDFFEYVNGEKPAKTLFDNVNTSWSRLKGGEKVQPLVDQAIREYREENAAASVPVLLQVRRAIQSLSPSVWRARKLDEVNQLIKDCLGLFVESTASAYWTAPGQPVISAFEIVNRSGIPVTLTHVRSSFIGYDTATAIELRNNSALTLKTAKRLSADLTYSDPYWLRAPHTEGMFAVPDPTLIGKPENDPAVTVTFDFQVQGEPFTQAVPLVFKWNDPVKGEQVRPFEIVPPVFVNLAKPVYLFRDVQPVQVAVLMKSAIDGGIAGNLKLDLPDGWRAEPVTVPFELKKKGEEKSFSFQVFPGKEETTSTINAVAEVAGKRFDRALHTIQYDHIPTQTLLPKATAKALRLDLKKEGGVVAYIQGAGDEVPASLRNMGYEVWEMKDEEVTPANLKRVDAVVLGVRALNTNDRIRHFMPDLLRYVNEGGTMVVQYNNNFELAIDADKFSPYPITLSRDRITEENSEVQILAPQNAVLNKPNVVTKKDFDGWVQERGLYYPSSWDSHYEAILSGHDKGEQPHNGGLLVAPYGDGYYVYTGLSFFRELPEGVPGAYKLFANLVSLGQEKKLSTPKIKSGTQE